MRGSGAANPAGLSTPRSNSGYRGLVIIALALALAGLALWFISRPEPVEEVPTIPLPLLTELAWEVADDAEIIEVSADTIKVRYVPLGDGGEDSNDNEYGTVHAKLPDGVVAGVVAEGYELRVVCRHEPTSVSVRVCRSGLQTNAGSSPAWGSYFGAAAPERGPEICRAVPKGSELQLTVFAYPAAPSTTYSEFSLRATTESTACVTE